jgi:adenine-specific DNA-methyltransferase
MSGATATTNLLLPTLLDERRDGDTRVAPEPGRSPNAFPRTRYQGSKRKLAGAICEHIRDLTFTSVLDAFGGTGAVSYALKRAGKHVVYNDILKFNHQIGLALIQNDSIHLSEDDLDFIQALQSGIPYDDFIERTFEGVYFTREENRWLDLVCQNIPRLECPYRRALAWFAVFQSAMIKRPYNLFHRSNLYMRTASVTRTFGNKTTWDGTFPTYFRRFAAEANNAVNDGGGVCRASCADALDIQGEFDLVYVDTPYIKRNRVGTDYLSFYHFLEGMVGYREWAAVIDLRFKHLPLRQDRDQPWTQADQSAAAFASLFERFRNSILCVSYRSDGIPSIEDISVLLKKFKRNVHIMKLSDYRYALSPNRKVQEILLIGS